MVTYQYMCQWDGSVIVSWVSCSFCQLWPLLAGARDFPLFQILTSSESNPASCWMGTEVLCQVVKQPGHDIEVTFICFQHISLCMSLWCGHGELLPILLELMFYVMIDSVQILGISLEAPLILYIVDIHADQDYCSWPFNVNIYPT